MADYVPTYAQPIKEEVRRRLLNQAIQSVTVGRDEAAVVRLDEFLHCLDYVKRFIQDNDLPAECLADLDALVADWIELRKSVIGLKTPADLRVLYLCGPEPINDLYVLREQGILPQNIWAVESDAKLYQIATEQLKQTGHFIHVHHGKLDRLFDQINTVFDVVYIDACGPFPGGRFKEIKVPLRLFLRERLAPISALVTTYALPPVEKKEQYTQLMTYYFAPRYNDVPQVLHQAGMDPAIAATDTDHLSPYIQKYFSESYSDFVTRFLVDLGRYLIPNAKIFCIEDLRTKYFANDLNIKKAVEKVTHIPKRQELEQLAQPDTRNFINAFFKLAGDAVIAPQNYPLYSFLKRTHEDKGVSSLLNALFELKIADTRFSEAYAPITFLDQIFEGHWKIASTELKLAISEGWFDLKGRWFCDVPLPHLLINSLFGIYGHPYLLNPRPTIRFEYTTKKTKMFSDCLLLDQCRYFFDLLPSIDLIPTRWASHSFQCLLRICLDRIGRHDFSSSTLQFRGTSLGALHEYSTAEWYNLEPRKGL